jgi:hypothetical protein
VAGNLTPQTFQVLGTWKVFLKTERPRHPPDLPGFGNLEGLLKTERSWHPPDLPGFGNLEGLLKNRKVLATPDLPGFRNLEGLLKTERSFSALPTPFIFSEFLIIFAAANEARRCVN